MKSVNEEARIILKSGLQNSERTCRQIPHGEQKSWTSPFLPPTMQIAENDFSPSLTALKIAVRSAQTVAPQKKNFNITATKNFPGWRKQCRTYYKIWIRRIWILQHIKCRRNKLFSCSEIIILLFIIQFSTIYLLFVENFPQNYQGKRI